MCTPIPCLNMCHMKVVINTASQNEIVTFLFKYPSTIFSQCNPLGQNNNILVCRSISVHLQAGSSSHYWWHLMTQRPIFELGTWDKSIKSMFFIDLIEQKQSLPWISLVKAAQKHMPAYESCFCGQALCQDLVSAAMMEGKWSLFPSGCMMSSEREPGSLIETCQTVHTAQWEQNCAALVNSVKDPAISFWVSDFIILFLSACRSMLWFVLLPNDSNCSTCFLGPLYEGGGCGAELLKCSSSLKFMWEEHAKLVWSL